MMSLSKTVPLEGKLDGWGGHIDVPDLLLAISREGRTGRLEISSADVERTIFFDDGRIVFATSSSPDDRLGAYLLLRNELGLADLRRLSGSVRPGLRLGSLLVKEGLMTSQALPEAVLGQVRGIVLDLFRWPRASYRFVEETPSVVEAITLEVPPARWILDGIEGVKSWLRVARGVGPLDVLFESVDGHEDSLRTIDLDTGSLELLAMLRHPKALAEICASSELPDIAICRRLWAFRLLEWVRADSSPGDSIEIDSDIEALGMILKDEFRRRRRTQGRKEDAKTQRKIGSNFLHRLREALRAALNRTFRMRFVDTAPARLLACWGRRKLGFLC